MGEGSVASLKFVCQVFALQLCLHLWQGKVLPKHRARDGLILLSIAEEFAGRHGTNFVTDFLLSIAETLEKGMQQVSPLNRRSKWVLLQSGISFRD